MTVLSTLEVLRRAEATLNDETVSFDFGQWESCTCGHIYFGVTGQKGSGAGLHPGEYRSVILDIARELGFTAAATDEAEFTPAWTAEIAYRAALYVSNLTHALATGQPLTEHYEIPLSGYKVVTREHALSVIGRAIRAIELREERARLEVLLQLRDVVDAVDVKTVTA